MATSEVRATFESEGWVKLPAFLGARTLASLSAAADELLAAGRDLAASAILRGVEYQVQSASGRGSEPAVAPGVFRKLVFPSKGAPAFARLKRDERVRRLLAELGLRQPRCVVDQLNLKVPRAGTGFPWHHDAAFLHPSHQRAIERDGGANLVIALDAADAGNGGFEVLPRTHRGGPMPFTYDTGAATAEVVDDSARTLIPLKPGDAVAFHPWLLHGSGPNPSDRPRRLVALWFLGGPPVTERGA